MLKRIKRNVFPLNSETETTGTDWPGIRKPHHMQLPENQWYRWKIFCMKDLWLLSIALYLPFICAHTQNKNYLKFVMVLKNWSLPFLLFESQKTFLVLEILFLKILANVFCSVLCQKLFFAVKPYVIFSLFFSLLNSELLSERAMFVWFFQHKHRSMCFEVLLSRMTLGTWKVSAHEVKITVSIPNKPVITVIPTVQHQNCLFRDKFSDQCQICNEHRCEWLENIIIFIKHFSFFLLFCPTKTCKC